MQDKLKEIAEAIAQLTSGQPSKEAPAPEAEPKVCPACKQVIEVEPKEAETE